MRVAALIATLAIVPSLFGGRALQRQLVPVKQPVAD
jgi:hypothetical protein